LLYLGISALQAGKQALAELFEKHHIREQDSTAVRRQTVPKNKPRSAGGKF
jgi:hypothetical protein